MAEDETVVDPLEGASSFYRAIMKAKEKQKTSEQFDTRSLEEREPERMAEFVDEPFTENEDGTIDCMFLHPVDGPILFTASPDDPEPHGRAIHAYLVSKMKGTE